MRVATVVDERDERRRDRLAHLTLEHRRVLQDVVGLETVTARLVEQHAARARFSTTGIRPDGAGTASSNVSAVFAGLPADVLGRKGVEELEAHRAAGRVVPGLHSGVAGGDALHRHARADPVVVGDESVGVRDEDAAAGVGVRRGHRRDRAARVSRPRHRHGPGARPCGASRRSRAGRPRRSIGWLAVAASATVCVPPPPPRAAPAAASAALAAVLRARDRQCARTRSCRREPREARRRGRDPRRAPRCGRRRSGRSTNADPRRTPPRNRPRGFSAWSSVACSTSCSIIGAVIFASNILDFAPTCRVGAGLPMVSGWGSPPVSPRRSR